MTIHMKWDPWLLVCAMIAVALTFTTASPTPLLALATIVLRNRPRR